VSLEKEDVPAEARERLRFVPLDTVEDAIREAIGGLEVERAPAAA